MPLGNRTLTYRKPSCDSQAANGSIRALAGLRYCPRRLIHRDTFLGDWGVSPQMPPLPPRSGELARVPTRVIKKLRTSIRGFFSTIHV
jgi:hypothetical protein